MPEKHEKSHQSDLLRIERLSRDVAKLENEMASRERHFNGKQTSIQESASSAKGAKVLYENETKLLREQLQETLTEIEKGEARLRLLRAHTADLFQQIQEIVIKETSVTNILEEASSKLSVAANRFAKDNTGLMKDIERARRRLATAQAYQEKPTP